MCIRDRCTSLALKIVAVNSVCILHHLSFIVSVHIIVVSLIFPPNYDPKHMDQTTNDELSWLASNPYAYINDTKDHLKSINVFTLSLIHISRKQPHRIKIGALKYMIANLIRGQFCVLFYQILMLVFL